MNTRTHLIPTLCAALGLALATPIAAEAQPAETAPDDTWITVSGTVVSTAPDAFRLDYGDGVITVEMDDFDFYPEGYQLLENDRVTVYGRVDDDLFEDRTIEASSAYVESLGTFFYASAVDEESYMAWAPAAPIDIGEVELTGVVTRVNGREFTVANDLMAVQVDTIELPYNPMDDQGFQQIEVGDRVRVNGEMHDALLDERELHADWIVELSH